jgi:hypothetical protein
VVGPKKEFMDMARGMLESFPEIQVDVYALAYWLQAWSEMQVQP